MVVGDAIESGLDVRTVDGMERTGELVAQIPVGLVAIELVGPFRAVGVSLRGPYCRDGTGKPMESASGPKSARSPNRFPAAPNVGHVPERLPWSKRIIEPESMYCPCGCGETAKSCEDRRERVNITPVQLRVSVTVGP